METMWRRYEDMCYGDDQEAMGSYAKPKAQMHFHKYPIYKILKKVDEDVTFLCDL